MEETRVSRYKFLKFILLMSLFFLGFVDAMAENNEGPIYIPVVFHVVYNLDEENISDEQILSQIVSLNDDFRSRNTDLDLVNEDFKASIGDSEIEFIYADKIINSQVESIVRVKTDANVFFNEDLFDALKGGSDPIDEDQILNIWVANLTEGLLGFYDQNGIAIDYKNFGTNGTVEAPYNLGRTLTHEIGHFFSLNHLWGLGGCDSDDGVDDTPTQSSEIIGCDLESSSCGSKDMTQNFMNTASDECLLFFTSGQIEKMRNHIISNLPEMILERDEIVLNSDLGLQKISFYPNPVNDDLIYIEGLPSTTSTFNLFSQDGRLVRRYQTSNGSIQLNNIKKGIYILTMEGENYYQTSKIIVE